MIVYIQATYLERKSQTLEGLRRIHDYVDRCVIVSSEPYEDWSELTQFQKAEYHQEPWVDDFPAYRNKCLENASPNDWVCVADPDEWYSESFCHDVRRIIEEADKQDIGLLLINSHDFFETEDGKTEERISTFFKNLIFKYTPEVHYEGVGIGRVHESLIFPPGTKSATLPRKYYYEHHKTWLEEKERAFRNVWIAGGGNNAGTINPRWTPLREITHRLELKTWAEARAYLRQGNIDKALLQWIIDSKDQRGWDWQNEMQDCFRYYKRLHPEEVEGYEIDPTLKPAFGSPPEVMEYVEKCYLEVLGRHADTGGKISYTNEILTGRIKREDLPKTLMLSEEYKLKFGGVSEKEGERVSVAVPVNVDVRVTEDSFLKAIMKSKTYWEKIRPKLELAEKWNRLLRIPRKAETGGKGLDEAPVENFVPFVEVFAQYCPLDKYQHILDVGAGCGSETKVLLDNGYKVIGITFGEDNIKYAKEKYGIELLEMDFHNLEFSDNFFDGVFMIQTFEHAFSPWLFIIELRRVLRDGGRVFLDTINPDDEEMLKTIWHTNVLYPKQIRALFWKAGFKEVTSGFHENRLVLVFEKLPDDQFEMHIYIKQILEKD